MPVRARANDRNEEVRGLFVIGVIAFLIILHYDPGIRNSSEPSLVFARMLIDILLAFWGGYAILAVVGFSEDIFGKRISEASYLVGLYALGCAVAYCLSFVILYSTTYVADFLYQFLLPCPPVHTVKEMLNCFFGPFGFDIQVFSVGLFTALYVPPILVAWGMSRTYGKKIWAACGFTILFNLLGQFWYSLAKDSTVVAILVVLTAFVLFVSYVKKLKS
jgi:hypothetical protein